MTDQEFPLRWAELPDACEAGELELRDLVRAAVPVRSFGQSQTALLRRRLFAGVSRAPARRWLQWALASVLLFTSGGVVGAALTSTGFNPLDDLFASAPVQHIVPSVPRRAQRQNRPQTIAVTTPPAVGDGPLAAEPKPLAATKTKALPAMSPPALPEEISPDAAPPSEIESIHRVFSTLRRKNAAQALTLIARHENRFTAGTFTPELTAARIEALLALGRKAEGLAQLESIPWDKLTDEQRVLRAELFTDAGRYNEARRDFTRVIESAAAPHLMERAFHGKAVCWQKTGDPARAERALLDYLFRFPSGKFAAETRKALHLPAPESPR